MQAVENPVEYVENPFSTFGKNIFSWNTDIQPDEYSREITNSLSAFTRMEGVAAQAHSSVLYGLRHLLAGALAPGAAMVK